MSMVTYREIREEDFPFVVKMYNDLHAYFYQVGYRLPEVENVGQLWLDSYRRTLGRFSNVFVAELDGQISGFLLCRLKRLPAYNGGMLVGEISDLWTNVSVRRMGIGSKLSRLAIQWLKEQGAHSVEVQILRENEGSWKLFEQLGFQLEYRLVRLMWEDYKSQDV